MREDNEATEVMNSFAECLDVCAILCRWPERARRDVLLDHVSWFVEAAPLADLPGVWIGGHMNKDMMRAAAAVATRIKEGLATWDGVGKPPPELDVLGREFLAAVGMQEILTMPEPIKEPPR